MSINRQWTDNIGADRNRKHSRGVAGTAEETQALMEKGFHQAASENGDVYYSNPGRGLIWLFPDGTWFGEKTPQGGTLRDYLDSIADMEFEEKMFHVVQVEGGLRNNLGQFDGAELYPYVVNRVDAATASAAFAELGQKGAVEISYKGSLGVDGIFQIKRIGWSPQPGDTFYYPNGTRGTVHGVSEGVVDISTNRNVAPIPLEHFAPHPNGDPNIWILVDLNHT